MGIVVVIGLGPEKMAHMTLQAVQTLSQAKSVFLRTDAHEVAAFLKEKNISVQTMDDLYDMADDFDGLYEKIAIRLEDAAQKCDKVYYGVHGKGDATDGSVQKLIARKKVKVEIMPGLGMESLAYAKVQTQLETQTPYVLTIPATEVAMRVNDVRVPLLIFELHSQALASEVKLALLEYYNDDWEIFYSADGIAVEKCALFELDRQNAYNHRSIAYIAPVKNFALTRFGFSQLMEIMATLRGKDGCPWDKEQTHETLRQYLLEETYEVLDALEQENMGHFAEELGDLLLQIVFHAQIGSEVSEFNMRDVATSVCEKMIRRHPHIFGDVQADTSAEVLHNWAQIKQKEKQITSFTQDLHDVPLALPALMRSQKVQQRASKAGFDWVDMQGPMQKIHEEMQELTQAVQTFGPNSKQAQEELGDLLFSVVNVSRFLGVQPELALNETTNKFILRFEKVEKMATEQQSKLKDMDIHALDLLWEKAKNEL